MGRKPIGEKPMTNAGKEMAYRERQDPKVEEMEMKLNELSTLMDAYKTTIKKF